MLADKIKLAQEDAFSAPGELYRVGLHLSRGELKELAAAVELAESCHEISEEDSYGKGAEKFWDDDAMAAYRAAKATT